MNKQILKGVSKDRKIQTAFNLLILILYDVKNGKQILQRYL